jgi:hypothetical protein
MLVDILSILVVHKLGTKLFTITYEKKKDTKNRTSYFFYSKILQLSFTIYVLRFKILSLFQHILKFNNLYFVLFMKIRVQACCSSTFKRNYLSSVTPVQYTKLQ